MAKPANKQDLIDSLQTVLELNDQGSFTIPAAGLYAHQWLWDSCFIAIGLRHNNVERAQKEILSLLRGQWANGMLPHIIFSDHDEHRRDRNVWRSWLNANAPDKVATSGITQPPMLAEAVVRVGEKLKTAERRTWYQTVFTPLLAYHQWLYADRDPHEEGTILQIHPWETGLDNTPPWMDELHQHQLALWIRAIDKLNLDFLINLLRRDTHYVPASQRAQAIDLLALYSIQRRLRRKAYDIDRILTHSLLAIEDLNFNCIFIRANHHLRNIAETIKRPLPAELLEKMHKTEVALEQFWDPYSSQYYSRNFVTHKLLDEPTIATLLPLYAGCISKERAKQLVQLLHDTHLFGTTFPVPSVPINSPVFQPLEFWQGPSWLNTNWLIIDGLQRYGYHQEAKQIADQSIEMVATGGAFEYFSPLTGEPAGADNFSWTAALTIDLLQS